MIRTQRRNGSISTAGGARCGFECRTGPSPVDRSRSGSKHHVVACELFRRMKSDFDPTTPSAKAAYRAAVRNGAVPAHG